MKRHRLQIPLQRGDLEGLEIGDVVFLDGVIYTGREGVYHRMIDEGHAPPVDLAALSNVNFHCSPAASVSEDGQFNLGAVTATASFRFAKWLPEWFRRTGCKAIIGKGGMNVKDYRDIFVPAGAVYLTTVGYGTGALLGRGVKQVRAAHWIGELGNAQALWVLEVENFGPLLVEADLQGNSLFEQHNKEIEKNVERLYAGLKPLALKRYGEINDKREELI